MNYTEEILLHIAKHETGCTSRALSHLVSDSNRRRQITSRLATRGLIESSEGVSRTGNRWKLTEAGREHLQALAIMQPKTSSEARVAVLAALANMNKSRRQLARRAAEIGDCSEVAVLQWLGGQTDNPTLRTWFAIEAALKI